MFSKREIRGIQRLGWNMMSRQDREAEIKRRREEHDVLIASMNEDFALVSDGPHIGEIVHAETGKRVSRRRIEALHSHKERGQAVDKWLADPRRRQISGEDLQTIRERQKG